MICPAVTNRLRNPVSFLVLFFSSSLLYFSELSQWWTVQLTVQLLICLVGFVIPEWRTTSFVVLGFLVLFNSRYFQSHGFSGPECHQRIDNLQGYTRFSSFRKNEALDLIRVRLRCDGEEIYRPAVRIYPDTSTQRRKAWFRKGDLLEVSNLILPAQEHVSCCELHPKQRFSIYNLSQKNWILGKSSLFHRIQAKARYYLDGFPLAVFKALVTADRSGFSKEWRQIMSDLGIMHIFAISGMHIGVIFLWLSFFCSKALSPLRRLSEYGYGILISDIAAVILIFLFLRFVGMPVSGKRALLMLSWWLVLKHVYHWQPLWYILFGTAVVIVLHTPVAIGQVAFQLSFLSVFAIFSVIPVLPVTSSNDLFYLRIRNMFASTVIVGCWIFLFTLPVMQQMTHVHSFLTPFNNLLHIFFVSFLLFPVLLLTFSITLITVSTGMWNGELYIFSIVNILLKTWQQLLTWTREWNQGGIFTLDIQWDSPLVFAYWIILTVSGMVLKWIIINRRAVARGK